MSEETPAPFPEETNAHKELPKDTGFTQEPGPAGSGAGTGPRFGLVLLVILTVAAAGYSYHEHNLARELAASNRATAAALDATRDQVNALTAKVNEIETKSPPETPAKAEPEVYRKPVRAAVQRHRVDDPRWRKMQGQLDEQGREIASTRENLEDTRTELRGSIATTHDELVLLQKKGERNYYEFDVDKSNGFERQGPINIRLRKANTKHAYADLELMVDDFKVSKKHVNIDEPVVFYPGDEKTPVELVINNIRKNHIHGYVSEPKYRRADLDAMANSGANPQVTTTSGDQASSDGKPSPGRRKLQLPAPSR